MNVLLVSGSRALEEADEKTQQQVRETIRKAVQWADFVVFGDAKGPDQWAHNEAMMQDKKHVLFCLDGHAYPSDMLKFSWDSKKGNPVLPLRRNEHMVSYIESLPKPKKVITIGFVSSKAKTNGTRHTLTLSEKAGFKVTERVIEHD